MNDDLEDILRRFRPAGPPEQLRQRILLAHALRRRHAARWPIRLYRTAVAALLLLALGLLHSADRLNQDSASRVGVGPVRWTAEAQQAADLIGTGAAGRQYIALCLIASNNPQPQNPPTQGAYR